uniref:Uncharacterized protein n=1 Tax=Oryza sativa subsp. japonica TaxID=39947 RepID=Q6UTY8_ORYSJ|nr:hypothetical protein OSJNBa0070J19.26 [Oryza sativa Japonica Group]
MRVPATNLDGGGVDEVDLGRAKLTAATARRRGRGVGCGGGGASGIGGRRETGPTGCFLFRMMTPLNSAKPGDLVSGPPFAGIKYANRLLHIGQVLLDIDVFRISLFLRYP